MSADPHPRGPEIRRILHIDMDAFYASVEQRDDPALRGRPVAVGGARARGVVAAASYEARRFGVRSAMPSVTAARLCPDLVFVKPRFDTYRAVSAQIRAIFARYTPVIEPLSLDEAYLDLSGRLAPGQSATAVAQDIRAAIRAQTGLTASAGVSYCKFLAKIASDQKKPDGLFVIPPEAGLDFVRHLPVAKFHGIGPATAARLMAMGVGTGADLAACDPAELVRRFGKAGAWYARIAQGVDDRPVCPDRARKSIGSETTFDHDLRELPAMQAAIAPLAEKVWDWAQKRDLTGRCVTLKVKFGDFRQVTRSKTLSQPVSGSDQLVRYAFELLGVVEPDPSGVRLLGVTLSRLEPLSGDDETQLDLFGSPMRLG